MSQTPQNNNTAIIVAVITGIFVCAAAVIGLGAPITKNLADRYIPTFTVVPTESISSVVAQETPTFFITETVSLPITPVITEITSTPNLNNFCPPNYGYGYAVKDGDFKPNMVIEGPATLHPFFGSHELGEVLGLESISRWGINIPSGRSVTIPATIILFSGKTYSPEGFYEIYSSDSDIAVVQQRWLQYCP